MQVFTVVLQRGLYSIFHLPNDWTLNTLFFKYIAWVYRFIVYIDISWWKLWTLKLSNEFFKPQPSFQSPFGHLYVFEEMSIRPSAHIFFFLVGLFYFIFTLSCISCLYILEINTLSVASRAHIFSHFESCLFASFIIFFAMWKTF